MAYFRHGQMRSRIVPAGPEFLKRLTPEQLAATKRRAALKRELARDAGRPDALLRKF